MLGEYFWSFLIKWALVNTFRNTFQEQRWHKNMARKLTKKFLNITTITQSQIIIMLNGILQCIVVIRPLVWCVKPTFSSHLTQLTQLTFTNSSQYSIKKPCAQPPRPDRKPATFFPTWRLLFSREWILPCNPIYFPKYREKLKSCYSVKLFLSTDTKHFHSFYLTIST